MTNLSSLIAVAAIGFAASGCATHEVAKLEARTTLASAPHTRLQSAENSAQASMAWRDHWTAANLFERAVEARPSPENRFNLAAAYQRTGRFEEAAANYRLVTEIGEYTWGATVPYNDYRDAPLRRVNLADESARRLAAMGRPVSYAPLAHQGALSATDVGVQASAIVGTTGRIPDQQAIQRDAAAEAARGR